MYFWCLSYLTLVSLAAKFLESHKIQGPSSSSSGYLAPWLLRNFQGEKYGLFNECYVHGVVDEQSLDFVENENCDKNLKLIDF